MEQPLKNKAESPPANKAQPRPVPKTDTQRTKDGK